MLTNTKNNKKTIRTIILLICLIIITFLIFVANKQYTNNIKGIEQELIKGENILKSAKVILASYYISIVIFIVLIIYLIGREKKELNQKGVYNRISRILGDSYYAVYLVNFEKESYTIIKGAEYIEDVMPKYGKYEELIDCFEAVIEKDAYEEFREIFSIKNIRRLIKTGAKNFGGDFKRKFGNEYKWVNIQMLYDQENADSEKGEIIFAFQHINERKEKELEEKQVLIESVETMELATQSKNRFFANMSHDMRTPLNAVINLSNMAMKQIDNKEKALDYLEKINISSVHLLDLINNILEVSKIEENTPLVSKVTTNITEKLKAEISIFEEQARLQSKSLHTSYNIKHDYVLCDWGKIRQIINNILSNALKYTNQYGNIWVEINEIEGKFVSKYEFKIKDDGIGMSKQFLEKIYTPFERETRFHSKEMNGIGLGMSIVQNNVQKMNGQIEIKSEPKKGSEVCVILPLELREDAQESKKELKEENLQDLSGARILVVEDNELNMEISTEILEMKGVKVTTATNGKQAVDIFQNSREGYFDAILMDIQMPVMDGYEATKAIRALPRRDAQNITILAVTASVFADEIVKIEKAGMTDYVGKPIDFAELQKALTKYMRKCN